MTQRTTTDTHASTSSAEGVDETQNATFVCVNCAADAIETYHQYSDSVLKLTTCNVCGGVVDKYVEYDVVLILLDLMLQNLSAYRHVLFNSGLKSYWRLAVVFLLCDAYNNWIQRKVKKDLAATTTADGGVNTEIYDLEWRFYLSVFQSLFNALLFMASLLLADTMLTPTEAKRTNLSTIGFVKRSLVGFYGNVLVVLAIVWQLHQSVSYVVLTRVFLFLSHVQIFRALRNVDLWFSVAVILCSTAIQSTLDRIASPFLWSLE